MDSMNKAIFADLPWLAWSIHGRYMGTRFLYKHCGTTVSDAYHGHHGLFLLNRDYIYTHAYSPRPAPAPPVRGKETMVPMVNLENHCATTVLAFFSAHGRGHGAHVYPMKNLEKHCAAMVSELLAAHVGARHA